MQSFILLTVTTALLQTSIALPLPALKPLTSPSSGSQLATSQLTKRSESGNANASPSTSSTASLAIPTTLLSALPIETAAALSPDSESDAGSPQSNIISYFNNDSLGSLLTSMVQAANLFAPSQGDLGLLSTTNSSSSTPLNWTRNLGSSQSSFNIAPMSKATAPADIIIPAQTALVSSIAHFLSDMSFAA